jgi:glycosyltransferase involved in cell wall biosynthesis
MGESALRRVVIGTAGRFHAYEQARILEQAGLLHRLVIGLPDPRATGVPRHKIVPLRSSYYLARLVDRLPFPASQAWSYYIGDNWFDRLAGRHVEGADIYHVYNHHGLHSMRRARRAGALTIVDRGSAHPRFVDTLLREEFARYGVPYAETQRRLLDKQVQEFRECDYIVVASDFIARTMVAEGVPAEKLLVLPPGFSAQRFHPGPRRDEVFRVVFAGAISLQKGVQYLLEGFRLAGLPTGRSELVLVGHPFREAGAFLPRYDGLYRPVGFVAQADLPDLLRSAAVFVLPSVQDGYAMVVREAAACGVPVIISENVGATIRDGEDGFVVPIRSAEAIAEKLVYLYTHEAERRRMGHSAREHALRFTLDHYGRSLIAAYRDVWSRRSLPR